MALTAKNWTLNSYTDATWTDLVSEPATVATLSISSLAASDVTVEVRIDDGAGVSLYQVLPPSILSPNEAFALDVRSINITGAQRLQVRVDAAGAEFLASGVV